MPVKPAGSQRHYTGTSTVHSVGVPTNDTFPIRFSGIDTNAVALLQAEGSVVEGVTPGSAVAAVPEAQQKGHQEVSGRQREVSRNQCINAEGS